MNINIVLTILIILFVGLPTTVFLVLKNNKYIKVLYTVLICLYIAIICLGCFTNISFSKGLTFSPYKHSTWFAHKFVFDVFSTKIKDFFINIMMLIPLGYLLPALFKKNVVVKTIIFGFVFSLSIELTQFVFPISRLPQLSDIIFNTLGCAIGTLFFVLVKVIKNKIYNKRKTKSKQI